MSPLQVIRVPLKQIVPGDAPREIAWKRLSGKLETPPYPIHEKIQTDNHISFIAFTTPDENGKLPTVVSLEENGQIFYLSNNATHRLAYCFKKDPDIEIEITLDNSRFNQFTANMIRNSAEFPKTWGEFIDRADKLLNETEDINFR